jgi:cell division protein FtsL
MTRKLIGTLGVIGFIGFFLVLGMIFYTQVSLPITNIILTTLDITVDESLLIVIRSISSALSVIIIWLILRHIWKQAMISADKEILEEEQGQEELNRLQIEKESQRDEHIIQSIAKIMNSEPIKHENNEDIESKKGINPAIAIGGIALLALLIISLTGKKRDKNE